jgi:antitoxin component YwqK of YwqJK toxin-antitoxin module
LEGKRTYYFDNGNVNYVVNYKNNVKEGPYIEYYDNAKVYVQGEFRQDKKEGPFVIKNKDGSIFGKEYWINGVKTKKPTKAKPLSNKAIADR